MSIWSWFAPKKPVVMPAPEINPPDEAQDSNIRATVSPRPFDQVGQYFYAYEFTASQTAARMGRTIVPTPEQWRNVFALVDQVLDPARRYLDTPIRISSGVRPVWLNAKVGGAANSAHISGRAADCTAIGLTAVEFAQLLHSSRIKFDKCIVEYGQWVHLQVAETGNIPRREIWTARYSGGGTVYTPGLA